jgi:Aromatic-ring-opening dioxygenase LigAB, LigA subunit
MRSWRASPLGDLFEQPVIRVFSNPYIKEDFVSCYHLSRLLFDLKMNESCVKRALSDFESVMAEYDLTAEEKQALRAGDPRKLRQLGVHGMLCLYIKRLHPEFRDNIYWAQK